MPTRHRTPMRTLVAMLLALTLLLIFVPPYADAAEAIALSKDVTLVSQTLDGTVLNVTAAATATATVNVLLQRCTAQGAGLTVSCATKTVAASSTAIALHILDTTATGATLAFNGYMPSASDVRVVNVNATMTGSTPLFDLQNFYLKAGSGSSMTIQRVRATWNSDPGGSMVLLGGSDDFSTLSGKTFSVSDAVVTGAAHVLEITPNCTANYCFDTSGGLNAVDLVEFRDARGAFMYSNTPSAVTTVSSSNKGMIRFSNITMTGGQPLFSIDPKTTSGVVGTGSGNTVFSAISSDGPLFSLTPGQRVCAVGPNVKYTFRHLNVASVVPTDSSYTANIPEECATPETPNTWNFYMGNITVDGTVVNTIDDLKTNHHLLATQLVGAYGEVIEVNTGGTWSQPSIGTAAAVNCVTERDGNAAFVELVPGVQRAECNCAARYSPPYCTTLDDPLVYYDAYSPSPAACAVANCDTCLFGQASQCGACSTGYQLTSSLECDKIPCSTPNCSECTTDDVCTACAASYALTTTTASCTKCTPAHCSQCVSPGDGTKCAACADGYKVNNKGECKKTGTPWWVWLIVGIAAAAVVAGVIVLVVCCLRRRRRRREAELNEDDMNTRVVNMTSTAWGVPVGTGGIRPGHAAPASPQKKHSDDFPKVRNAWVSPAVIDDPQSQSTHSGSRHGGSDDCHAVRAAQEAETIVANPLEDTYCYPFEGYKEEVRSPSRDATADVGSQGRHSVPPTSTHRREGQTNSHKTA